MIAFCKARRLRLERRLVPGAPHGHRKKQPPGPAPDPRAVGHRDEVLPAVEQNSRPVLDRCSITVRIRSAIGTTTGECRAEGETFVDAAVRHLAHGMSGANVIEELALTAREPHSPRTAATWSTLGDRAACGGHRSDTWAAFCSSPLPTTAPRSSVRRCATPPRCPRSGPPASGSPPSTCGASAGGRACCSARSGQRGASARRQRVPHRKSLGQQTGNMAEIVVGALLLRQASLARTPRWTASSRSAACCRPGDRHCDQRNGGHGLDGRRRGGR